MTPCARVAAAAVLALVCAGCVGDGTGDAGGGGQLEVSGSVSARLEGRLSESGALPDSAFWWVSHLDVRSDGFTVVDDRGFVIVGGLDLEVAQVVERSEDQRRGHLRPVASRVDGGRLLVMDGLLRNVWAYPLGSGDGAGFGELVVDVDMLLRTGDTRAGARTGQGWFGMLTDFAVRADGSIVAPMHEGPTYLGVLWPPRDSVAAGPAWDTRADAGEFGQLFRYSNRVTGLGDGGLLVWDDYSAVVIAVGADGTESRWSLPGEYRRTGPPEMWPRYGSDVEVELGKPTMTGWSAVDGSVCMAVRPVDGDQAHLFWLDLGGAGTVPTLRRVDVDVPMDAGRPVSCGIVGDVLLVGTVQDVLRYRLGTEAELPG